MELAAPDDMHLHLRDGAALSALGKGVLFRPCVGHAKDTTRLAKSLASLQSVQFLTRSCAPLTQQTLKLHPLGMG